MYRIEKSFYELISNPKIEESEELNNSFLTILNTIDDKRLMNIIREFPKFKPIIKFKTLYYVLEEFKPQDKLDYEFSVLKNYINHEIDVFMLVNYLKKERRTKKIKNG